MKKQEIINKYNDYLKMVDDTENALIKLRYYKNELIATQRSKKTLTKANNLKYLKILNQLHIDTLLINIEKQFIDKDNFEESLEEKRAEYNQIITLIQSIEEKENYIFSKSPYSHSIYYHSNDDTIDWGVKPLGSIRISNHWNWVDRYENLHCKVLENKYISELQVRVMTENGYQLI